MTNADLHDARRIIKLTLIKIGIRCDLIGFSYLCYAVELVIQEPQLIHNLCNGLYEEVCKRFDVEKKSCVERSIRHAIDNTYNCKSFAELNKMFNIELYSINDKPTAGELINLVAEYYNLGLYKTDGISKN